MGSFMSININITFMHISRFILASKSTSFTFFIWIFAYIITFLHGRFIYVHTFFHCKIMCSCRLITCLYDIQQTSYERRFHHSHVAPPEPIWAEFTSTIYKICQWSIRAATASKAATSVGVARPYYIYAHICRGKWWCCNPHTRTWENPARFFARRAIICIVYCWEKCKKL